MRGQRPLYSPLVRSISTWKIASLWRANIKGALKIQVKLPQLSAIQSEKCLTNNGLELKMSLSVGIEKLELLAYLREERPGWIENQRAAEEEHRKRVHL
jgi:hypothetical protein